MRAGTNKEGWEVICGLYNKARFEEAYNFTIDEILTLVDVVKVSTNLIASICNGELSAKASLFDLLKDRLRNDGKGMPAVFYYQNAVAALDIRVGDGELNSYKEVFDKTNQGIDIGMINYLDVKSITSVKVFKEILSDLYYIGLMCGFTDSAIHYAEY